MEISTVKAIMEKNIGAITNYHEQAIEIVKLPMQFPTGFLMQQVDAVSKNQVSGPAYTVHEIQNFI